MNYGSSAVNVTSPVENGYRQDLDALHLLFAYRGTLPVPDVTGEGGAGWEAAWRVYTLAMGTAFFLQAGFVLTMLLCHCYTNRASRRTRSVRVRQASPLATVHLCLVPFGVLTGMSLILPAVLTFISTAPLCCMMDALVRATTNLDFLGRVALLASYAFLLHVILKVTRVRIGPKPLQNTHLISLAFCALGSLFVCIDITISKKNHLRCLILLPQCIYAITCLFLCFIFIYKGFRIAQFMLDTNTMFYEILAYERLKREFTECGNRRDLALCRLRRLTYKGHEPEVSVMEAGSTRTEGNASHSSDSDDWGCPVQQDHLSHHVSRRTNGRHLQTAKAGRCDSSLVQDTYQPDYITSLLDNLSDLAFTTSDCMTETPTTGVMSLDDQFWDQFQRASHRGASPGDAPAVGPSLSSGPLAPDKLSINLQPSACNGASLPLNCLSESDLRVSGRTGDCASEPASLQPGHGRPVNCIPPPATTGHQVAASSDAVGETCNEEHCFQFPKLMDPRTMVLRDEDRGYMADSELSSPCLTPRPHPRPSQSVPVSPQHSLPQGCPQLPALPHTAPQWLGLRRIRQGRLLSRILKLTYFSTLFLFISTVLHLYAMFGVYGVLATRPKVSPWPWLVFKALHRLCELVTGGTLTHSLYRLGQRGARVGKANRQKQQEDKAASPHQHSKRLIHSSPDDTLANTQC